MTFNSLTHKPIRQCISCHWKNIFGFSIISTRSISCLSDFYTIPGIQYMQISDGLTHYVNHFCLLEQIISWLPLAELGAETIWFPCVYFTLASVKVVQSDFTGRHHRRTDLKSPISESVCLCISVLWYQRIQQGTSFSCSIAPPCWVSLTRPCHTVTGWHFTHSSL